MRQVRVGPKRFGGAMRPCAICGDVPSLLARPHKPDPMRAGVCERCARRAVAMFDRYAAGRVVALVPGDDLADVEGMTL